MYFIVLIDIGEEKIGELGTIHQNFPFPRAVRI